MVPATVNGLPGLFMVDTGAFYSSISNAGVAKYHLKVGPSAFGMTVTGVGRGDTGFSLGTAKMFIFDTLPFNDADFMILEGDRGGEDDGAIGQNILGAPDVEYDLANGAIRLFKETGCQQASLAYWDTAQDYSVVSIQSEGFLSPPVSSATLNGVKIRVVFDTGTPRSMVSLQAAARAGVGPSSPGVISAGYSAGVARRSQFSVWRARFNSFKLGDEEIKNTPLLIGDMKLTNADMLLGADFFLSHRLFVSSTQHKVYFTYNGGAVFNLETATQTASAAQPAASASSDSPEDAPGLGRRAAASMSRHEYAAAIADLTQAIALAPDDADYLYQRGRAELANHQPLLGKADLDATLKLKPDHVAALIARAEIYAAVGQPIQARADLDAADKSAARDSDLRLGMAEAYARMHLYAQSLPQLDTWISTHPDGAHMATALNNRCWFRAELGTELDKALADCNAALRLDPGNPGVLDSRGLVLLRQGDLDKAIADYNAALALRPNTAWSLYGRGLARLRKGLTKDGQADVAAATVLNPRLPDEARALGLTP
jgi:tetratricopeptide (TPR) repeat protein